MDDRPVGSDEAQHQPQQPQQPVSSGQASGKLSQDFLDRIQQSLLELRLGPRQFNAYNRYQFLT